MKKQPQQKLLGQGLAAALSLALSVSTVPMSAQAVTWECYDDYWDYFGCWNNDIPTSADNVYVYTVGGGNTYMHYSIYPKIIFAFICVNSRKYFSF